MLSRIKKLKRDSSIVFGRPGNDGLKESYIRLKDNILYYSLDGKRKVFQFESSIAAEGKTTSVANVCVCLGLSGKKVVVLDLDFRKPRLHRSFEIENAFGIADYMLGNTSKSEIIKQTKYENVSIINRGSEVANSSVVLTSEKLKQFIDELREEYDFVILDCPPVLLVSDYIHISRLSDGVIFVCAYGITKKKQVDEAMRLLKINNIEVVGAVYTFYNPKRSNNSSEYSVGYYNYYGYGEKSAKK